MTDHTTNNPSRVKTCTKCGESKPATIEYFPSDKNKPDGLFWHCKKCHNARASEYRAQNRDLIRARKNKRYATNAELREQHVAEMLEYQRAMRRHPDESKRQRFLASDVERNRRYRARKRQARGHHTVEDVLLQYQKQDGCCFYCKAFLANEYQTDHVVPLSRGGSDAPENIVVSCASCNASKGDKLLDEWIEYKKMSSG